MNRYMWIVHIDASPPICGIQLTQQFVSLQYRNLEDLHAEIKSYKSQFKRKQTLLQ
jgi:hypothetical protein